MYSLQSPLTRKAFFGMSAVAPVVADAPPDVPEAASVARFEELVDVEEAAGKELPGPNEIQWPDEVKIYLYVFYYCIRLKGSGERMQCY